MWHYSLGIDVAARLIEVISGQRLGDFLQERLFGPLGMTDTAFGVPSRRGAASPRCTACRTCSARTRRFSGLAGAFADRRPRAPRRRADLPERQPDVFQRGGVGLFGTGPDYLRFADMLLTGKAEDGTRILGRKTLELMHTNHLAPACSRTRIGGVPAPGFGFGLGSRVAMDVGQTALPAPLGEFGWAGAAKTYFWVDPVEELVGVIMTQYMVGFDLPEADFRAVVYQSIED